MLTDFSCQKVRQSLLVVSDWVRAFVCFFVCASQQLEVVQRGTNFSFSFLSLSFALFHYFLLLFFSVKLFFIYYLLFFKRARALRGGARAGVAGRIDERGTVLKGPRAIIWAAVEAKWKENKVKKKKSIYIQKQDSLIVYYIFIIIYCFVRSKRLTFTPGTLLLLHDIGVFVCWELNCERGIVAQQQQVPLSPSLSLTHKSIISASLFLTQPHYFNALLTSLALLRLRPLPRPSAGRRICRRASLELPVTSTLPPIGCRHSCSTPLSTNSKT